MKNSDSNIIFHDLIQKSTALKRGHTDTPERYTLDELFSEDEVSESESEFSDVDSDWMMTPQNIRKKKARMQKQNDQSKVTLYVNRTLGTSTNNIESIVSQDFHFKESELHGPCML